MTPIIPTPSTPSYTPAAPGGASPSYDADDEYGTEEE